jgi:hypothetical protein
VLLPDGVVTVTLAPPGANGHAGVVTETDDAVALVGVAVTEVVPVPKVTVVASSRLEPAISNGVPPETGPVVGLIPETAGADIITRDHEGTRFFGIEWSIQCSGVSWKACVDC